MPEATVAAIVTRKDDEGHKILLTRRNVQPFRGQWCLPGGHIERYERARDAVMREIKEETGLGLDARFFMYLDELIPEHGIHYVVMIFEGQAGGILAAPVDEVIEAGWFTLEEAQSLPLAFTHNEALKAYAQHTHQDE